VPPTPDPAEHSITMWGPPATGKTTFLAALSIALIRHGSVWRVNGVDEASTDTLIKLTMGLATDRCFPPATVGIAHYRWALDGRLMRKIPRRWFGSRLAEQDVRIPLNLVDSQGRLVGRQREGSAQADLVKNLNSSSAIVFLYDPIREFDRGDAFDHTFGVLKQMSQQLAGSPGEKLPHYVAVCVTKFDEIRIISTAEKLGLISDDPDLPGYPRVADEDARELFGELSRIPHDSDADLVLNLLEQNFHHDRIKYFITSAIGFYIDPRAGVFDPDNYQNHLPDPDDRKSGQSQSRIRGPIRPINVVEPVLWLADKITSEPGK
jgi:hypothetical protein